MDYLGFAYPNQPILKAGNINKALILYAKTGQVGDLRRVIAKGAKINVTDLDGNTALIHAAFRGHAEVVELLLQHGADPTIQDCENHTASDHARAQGHETITNALITAVASWSQRPPPPPKRTKYDINEILSEPSVEEVLYRLNREITKDSFFLSVGEQLAFDLYDFEQNVAHFGFGKYFLNRNRREVENTLDSLVRAGASISSGLMREALSIFDEGRFPSGDEYQSSEVSNKTEKLEPFLKNLDKLFSDRKEDLQQLAYLYITTHKEEFGHSA